MSQKKAQLIAEPELCFEAVVVAIEAGSLLDVLEHPSRKAQRHYTTTPPLVKAMPDTTLAVKQPLDDFEHDALLSASTFASPAAISRRFAHGHCGSWEGGERFF